MSEGSCPQGICPRGSFPMGSCPRRYRCEYSFLKNAMVHRDRSRTSERGVVGIQACMQSAKTY